MKRREFLKLSVGTLIAALGAGTVGKSAATAEATHEVYKYDLRQIMADNIVRDINETLALEKAINKRAKEIGRNGNLNQVPDVDLEAYAAAHRRYKEIVKQGYVVV